jgi:hypothetical protein
VQPASVAHHHPLTGGHELPGEQIAEPASTFDRPRPVTEPCRPPDQPLELAGGRPHPQLAEELLAVVQRHRSVRRLVRVDPDHHCHQLLLHDLYLMATNCDISWTMVGQAARGTRDDDLTEVVQRCEGDTATQLAWLRTRMKQAAPQALVVA